MLALRRPWGFDLSRSSVPVLLWHGAEDVFSPVGHTRWLAKQDPADLMTPRAVLNRGAAHFGAVEILPSVLAWIKVRRGSEGLRVQGVHQPVFST